MNSIGDIMVGFNTGGSIVPISKHIIMAWQLIGGRADNVSIIYDISMGVEIEKIIKGFQII